MSVVFPLPPFVLLVISTKEEISPKEIRLTIEKFYGPKDKTQISHVLSALYQKDLVNRQTQNRPVTYTLTPQGRKTASRLKKMIPTFTPPKVPLAVPQRTMLSPDQLDLIEAILYDSFDSLGGILAQTTIDAQVRSIMEKIKAIE